MTERTIETVAAELKNAREEYLFFSSCQTPDDEIERARLSIKIDRALTNTAALSLELKHRIIESEKEGI